jgi:hypothetical protein
MDAETLKVVAQVAGIGGIALAVLLMVFREVIQKNIFTSLSPEEGYRLLRLIIVSTWSVAIIGVGAWIYTKTQGAPTVDAAGTVVKEFAVSGLITDADNNGLGDVDVFMVGGDDHVRTNDSGAFRLKIKAAENSIVNVRVAKQGYKARTENVKLPTSGLIVALTATAPATTAPVAPAPQPTSSGGGGDAPSRTDVSRPREASGGGSVDRPRDPPPSKTGRVYIRYTGDVYGCNLFVTFRLGERTVSPVAGPGQNFPVNDIPLGETEYVVGGTITCPSFGGACTAAGSGRLKLENERIYDVVWTPNYPTCPVRLAGLP